MVPRSDFLFAIPTWGLALVLLAVTLAVLALGARSGARRASLATSAEKDQVAALRGSLLGLLALLVGFSFSLAVGRFNDRSLAVVTEANTIGTAWLRSDLLAGEQRDALRSALADYAASRLAAGGYDIYRSEDLAREGQTTAAAFAAAWKIAAEAARTAPNPVTLSVATALNDMTDAFSSHEAALRRHVPAVVLGLMAVSLLFLGWVVGFASGEAGERTPALMLLMMGLIVLLLALIMDLDRPRRGVIMVDQAPMIAATTQVLTEAGRPLPASP